jgi:hypothetical protein
MGKQFTKADIAKARKRIKPKARKKKISEMGFGEILAKKVEQMNKRHEKNMALYRKIQKQQGKKKDEPISLTDLLK